VNAAMNLVVLKKAKNFLPSGELSALERQCIIVIFLYSWCEKDETSSILQPLMGLLY